MIPTMTLDLDKLRSIGHLKGGRTMSRTKTGREHPDSGLPFQATTDEAGNVVTEHGAQGTGLSERQDVEIHAEPVTMDLDMKLGG
jgi:hypothetical protein